MGPRVLANELPRIASFKQPTLDTVSRSRGAMRPSCACLFRPKERGRGECRAPSTPAASCAKWVVQNAHEYSQRSHRKSPGIPARNGLRLISCSPRRSGFLVTVASGMFSRRLDAGVEASGPHDFAVRTRALSSLAPHASTASHPASVTIAIRPSSGAGRREYARITECSQAEF